MGLQPFPMNVPPDATTPGLGEVVPFMMPEPQPPSELDRRIQALAEMAGMVNAAEDIDAEERDKIGDKVVREYKIDEESRKEWREKAQRAMDMARQQKTPKTSPWPGAANIKYPLITTAALQFAARAYPAICDGQQVVKCKVMGYDPEGIKAGAGERVSQHMSYQLLYEVDDWESSVDTALHQIPIVGCAFRKVYEDTSKLAGFCDDLVSAFDFVVNQKTKSLKTVPRATHVFSLYPHEIRERQRAGRYLDVDIRGQADQGNGDEDEDAPHTILEQHRYLDLDDDGIEEPWIVTVHEKTHAVLRITACFDPADIKTDMTRGEIISIPRRDYFVKIPFIPDPEGGFYDVGFGHLLEPLSDVIDATLNQMMDAGTLQNAGGGFIGAGVQLGKGKSTIKLRPGEWQTVQSAGADLRQAFYRVEHPGPSSVLFELLGLMIEAGKEVAAIKDVLTGESPGRVQTATTTMALIEQGLKVFTAIYKRIFRAMREEFRLIFEINKRNMQNQLPKYVALLDEPVQVSGQDYMGELDIMPVADPNTVTDMQRMSKAQMLMEMAQGGAPIDPFIATRRMLEAARIEKPEEVMIPPPDPNAPKEPTPEEIAAQAKAAELQAKTEAAAQQAQINQQSKMLDLEAKAQDLMLQFAAKQRDAELKAIESERAFQEKLRALDLQSETLNQKFRELDLREEQMQMKAEEARAKVAAAKAESTAAE